MSDWLAAHPEQLVLVRINARQTEWFNDDLSLLKYANVSAIVLPKTEAAADVDAVSYTHLRAGWQGRP